MVGNTEKLYFPKYKSPINDLDESAGQKRQIYIVKEISKEIELKQNGNTLPTYGNREK